MRINITAIKLDLTPAFKVYIEKRLAPLEKVIARFDPAGGAELQVEVVRTTRHHRHGEIYRAAANLRLPKTTLRAEELASDPRAAVDAVNDILEREIGKYRTKFLEVRRRKNE